MQVLLVGNCSALQVCCLRESSIVRGEGVKPFVATRPYWPWNAKFVKMEYTYYSNSICTLFYIEYIANLFRDMANCTTRNVLLAA